MGALLFQTDEDSQLVNASIANDFLLNVDEGQFLVSPNYAPAQYQVVHEITENMVTLDGIKLLAYLDKDNGQTVQSTDCRFRLYSVNQSSLLETLLHDSTNLPDANNRYIKNLTVVDLGGLEPVGDIVFLLRTTITRFSLVLNRKEYFNHIGIFLFTESLRRRLRIMESSNKIHWPF
jgi:hypothetical protein